MEKHNNQNFYRFSQLSIRADWWKIIGVVVCINVMAEIIFQCDLLVDLLWWYVLGKSDKNEKKKLCGEICVDLSCLQSVFFCFVGKKAQAMMFCIPPHDRVVELVRNSRKNLENVTFLSTLGLQSGDHVVIPFKLLPRVIFMINSTCLLENIHTSHKKKFIFSQLKHRQYPYQNNRNTIPLDRIQIHPIYPISYITYLPLWGPLYTIFIVVDLPTHTHWFELKEPRFPTFQHYTGYWCVLISLLWDTLLLIVLEIARKQTKSVETKKKSVRHHSTLYTRWSITFVCGCLTFLQLSASPIRNGPPPEPFSRNTPPPPPATTVPTTHTNPADTHPTKHPATWEHEYIPSTHPSPAYPWIPKACPWEQPWSTWKW